jgi:hypothetical protein
LIFTQRDACQISDLQNQKITHLFILSHWRYYSSNRTLTYKIVQEEIFLLFSSVLGWRHDSSGRVSAWQACTPPPSSIPSTAKKKKN